MKRATAHESYPVVILGAGPAGLAMGYELASRGVDFVILEKGPAPGHSFANFPRNIFFGPWLNNMLPGSRVNWRWKFRRSTQPAYTAYLQEYCRRHKLPVRTGVEVQSTNHQSEGFQLETNRGKIWSKLLVNATGYFTKPNVPKYPGLETTQVPWMHVAHYGDPESLRRKLGRRTGRVLVVGKRLSAGETMCELHRSGFQVGLSHRGKLKFGPSQFQEALISPAVWLVERAAVLFRIKKNSYPRMAGGESQRLIQSGLVPTFPDIERFTEDGVVFKDGRSEQFDFVVFATGYKPALDHLAGLPKLGIPPETVSMESVEYPGLFFLGIDQLRTFRSRFLRGIVEDARCLGDIVARRAFKSMGKADSPVMPPPVELEMEPLEDEEATLVASRG